MYGWYGCGNRFAGSGSGCSWISIDSGSSWLYCIWSRYCFGGSRCVDCQRGIGGCVCCSSFDRTIWKPGSGSYCSAWCKHDCFWHRSCCWRNWRNRARSWSCVGRCNCAGCSRRSNCIGRRSSGAWSFACDGRCRFDNYGSSISTCSGWCKGQCSRIGGITWIRYCGQCGFCDFGRIFWRGSCNSWCICSGNGGRSRRNRSYGSCSEISKFQHEVNCWKCKERRKIAHEHEIERQCCKFRIGCIGEQSKKRYQCIN